MNKRHMFCHNVRDVLRMLQGDEIAAISIDNPEFEGISVEEEPVLEEWSEEEEEQQQQPGVLEGAVDSEGSAAAAAEGVEGAEAAARPEADADAAGGEGSGADGAAGDEDDDGFVKVRRGFQMCRWRPVEVSPGGWGQQALWPASGRMGGGSMLHGHSPNNNGIANQG